MKPIRPAVLLLAAAAACGTPEDAVPEPHGGAPTDTLGPDSAPRDPRVDAVERRLEQAERDAAARNREAMEAMEPR